MNAVTQQTVAKLFAQLKLGTKIKLHLLGGSRINGVVAGRIAEQPEDVLVAVDHIGGQPNQPSGFAVLKPAQQPDDNGSVAFYVFADQEPPLPVEEIVV